MSESAKFPCTSCGGCCRRVWRQPAWPRQFMRDDGSCVFLGEDSRCRIYDNRPDLCQISKGGTTKEWMKQNAEICNKIMDEDKFDGPRIDVTLL